MRMKKKRHGQERLSQLGVLFPEEPISKTLGMGRPLRIEIGCGKGDFIVATSEREPDYTYLAIEKVPDVCVVAAEKYASSRGLGSLAPNGGWKREDGTVTKIGEPVAFTEEECGNVRFALGDASVLLDSFPDASVETVYLNFSDPWSKKGYAKRRLTHLDFLRKYERILTPGGYLCFKTDNRDLFDFSLEQVALSNLSLTLCTYDLHHSEYASDNVETEYERNFASQGLPIHKLVAKKG